MLSYLIFKGKASPAKWIKRIVLNNEVNIFSQLSDWQFNGGFIVLC